MTARRRGVAQVECGAERLFPQQQSGIRPSAEEGNAVRVLSFSGFWSGKNRVRDGGDAVSGVEPGRAVESAVEGEAELPSLKPPPPPPSAVVLFTVKVLGHSCIGRVPLPSPSLPLDRAGHWQLL